MTQFPTFEKCSLHSWYGQVSAADADFPKVSYGHHNGILTVMVQTGTHKVEIKADSFNRLPAVTILKNERAEE